MDKTASEQFKAAFIANLTALEDQEVKTASLVASCQPFAKLARFYGLISDDEVVQTEKVATDEGSEKQEADGYKATIAKLRELRN